MYPWDESSHTLMVCVGGILTISIPNAAHMHNSGVPFYKDTSLRIRDQHFVR